MDNTRKIAFTAIPSPPSELKTLFIAADGSIRRLLERPPSLRSNGWDLQTGDTAETFRGEMARVAIGDRKVAELYRDGTFIFACRADDWFLAWATPKHLQRINPLALVEATYSFTSFYTHVIADLVRPPHEVRFRIDVRNMKAQEPKSSLVPYALDSFGQVFEQDLREAPENDATLREVVSPSQYDPESVAYQLVREIYRWFGFTDDNIPYVTRDKSGARINLAAITKT